MNREEKIKAIYKKVAEAIIDFDNIPKCKPVYIGDMLDFVENDYYFEIITDIQQELIEIWGHKRKPLEEQSDETIDYLFNLIIGEIKI